MSGVRNAVLFLGTLVLINPGWAAVKSAAVHFNSACDFTALRMEIIRAQALDPALITLNITLQPAASRRLAQVSRDYMNQSMTLYINDVKINSSTIREELNIPHLQVAVDRLMAQKLYPGLLNTTCRQGEVLCAG